MVKKILFAAIIVLYVALSIFAAFVGVEKIQQKYSPSDEVIPFFSQDGTSLVIEDRLIEDPLAPVVTGGEIFLPFEIVKEYIDPTIFKDMGGRVVTVISSDRVIRMDSLEMESYVNMEPFTLDFTARYIDNILYIPVRTFSEIFGIDVTYIEQSNTVVVDYWKNYIHHGFVSPFIRTSEMVDGISVERYKKVSEDVVIRSEPSIKAPLYRKLADDGEEVIVYSVEGEWARIRTGEGIIGYVETRFLEAEVMYTDISVNLSRSIEGEPDRIVLAWQYINKTTPPVEDFISHEEITVYSPTWFTVIDSEGNMENKSDLPYVQKVRELGAVIWPLVNNTFNDINMTSAILNDPDARDNVIRQLMAYAQLYELDGYNMDFENIYLRDRDAYTQFIRELMPYARAMGLVITVDVGIPGGSDNYSLCYDHRELSRTADYIMVMTYDQHWASSPVAGSQAQLVWVEEMINETLELVEPNKLILGIPFYTRIWQETGDKVKNVRTPGMDRVQEIIEEKEAYVVWDEESGQFYASYYEDGAIYRMWIEDAVSVGLKAELALKYGLRGVAIWQLPLGNDSAWESISRALDGEGVD
ncbi:MAG TPA: glycosyl hydrolase family 18 protein [Clostridia bacterium]|nr:glycosyl hydrolase family 18 protein [Clostridia bacterium]